MLSGLSIVSFRRRFRLTIIDVLKSEKISYDTFTLKNNLKLVNFFVSKLKNVFKRRIFDKNLKPVFLTKIAIKIPFFGCHNKNISQNEECHTSLSSLLNFQSIGIQT